MLFRLITSIVVLTQTTIWALPTQPVLIPRSPGSDYFESLVQSRKLQSRALNPDDQNIWLWKLDSFDSGTVRNLRTEDSDEARRELQQLRGALTQARVLAERALAVDANDPLWTFYFGNGPNQQATARRVFERIRDFAPSPQERIIINRIPTPARDPTNFQLQWAARARAEMRNIEFFDVWAGLPELARTVTQPLPNFPLNQGRRDVDEENMDQDAATLGPVMMHELVHYVTFWDPNTFQPLHTELNNLRQQRGLSQLDFRGALDIRPAQYIFTQRDTQIVDQMRQARDDQGRPTAAYHYNELTHMAEMQHGNTLTLMNAQNYVHFAIAAFFNRRAGVTLTGPPTAANLANRPTAWINGLDDQFYQDASLRLLLFALLMYNRAGALGNVKFGILPP